MDDDDLRREARARDRDIERVTTRGDELMTEEERAGSDDRYAQAAEILEESDQRVEEGGAPSGEGDAPDGPSVERRRSEDTVDHT